MTFHPVCRYSTCADQTKWLDDRDKESLTMSSMSKVTNHANARPGEFHAGLENIVAAQTRLSRVEGERGELTIAGFAVEEIAPRATFEEMVHLLWYHTLPNRDQLAEFRARLAAERTLSAVELNVLRAAAV